MEVLDPGASGKSIRTSLEVNDKTPRALGCGEEPDELNLGVAVEFFFGSTKLPTSFILDSSKLTV